MKLTLRTLLAYLDDVLDPADKEELAQKIEASEFAQDLVHRTRDTMRRLRLSAPQVIGAGTALDPNTVAEYLDNALPPEQVGEFERICLESDVHLAEAAACHHVLTMILGEPAEVDPRSRQRMYRIHSEARERKRHRLEAAHVPGMTTAVVAAGVPTGAMSAAGAQPARAVEIPEYLRTRPWWQSPATLAALAAVLLVGITLMLASGLWGWFGGSPSAMLLNDGKDINYLPPAEASQPVAPENGGAATAPAIDSPPQPMTPGISAPPASEPTAADPYGAPVAVEGASDDKAAGAARPEAATEGTVHADVQAAAVPDAGEIANVVPPSRYDAPPADTQSAAAIPPANEPTTLPPPDPTADSRAITRLPVPDDRAPPADPGVVAIEVEETITEAEPAAPADLGTYLGTKTVLLRYDEAAGAWFRVEPRQAVIEGQRLLALPEFRPKITLTSGVHLDMAGGTQVMLASAADLPSEELPAAEADVPAIDLLYGRTILINTSNRENRVRLKLGPTVAEARLARNATLAIELERQYVPGRDPRKAPAPVAVRLHAPDGGVNWQDEAGEMAATAASQWALVQGARSELAADAPVPEWLDEEPAATPSDQLQRRAAPRVESAILSNRPVDIQLLELYQGTRQREVKSLVARASIHVGLFEVFVNSLRDSELRWPTWKTHIETLRAAMALSPESAEKVWQTLVQQRGEPAAADLYEMLCGYSADQIGRAPELWKTGAMSRLIDWLEEDSLDYRVLAVHNLWEITGKQLMPDPAARVRDRERSVRVWRSRLESGELRPMAAEEEAAAGDAESDTSGQR